MINLVIEKLNIQKNYDVRVRVLNVNNIKIGFVFLDFLTDGLKVNDIIYSINDLKQTITKELLVNHLMNASVNVINDVDNIVNSILKGDMAIFIEHETTSLVVDTKKYPGRIIGEPDGEKVVRGSRDGFTETLSTNVALVRRRIASTDLTLELYTIGKSSKTYVVLCYLKSIIDDKVLIDIREKLNKVKISELIMSDKALEEHLVKNPYSPYPIVKYTERPDTFCAHLYQGMFGLLVDTSPSAILGPVSIFDHMQHAEEFRQTIIAGSYLRFIRFIGIVLGFLIIPIWFSLISVGKITIDESLLNIFIQLLSIEVAIEIIRMASIHTPSALSTSMGLIAGIVIGDMAVNLGVINQTVAFLGSVSALSSYITPSYELSLANKIVKLILIFSIYLFNIYGLIFGIIVLIIYLASLKSFTRSYLYPLIPFNFKGFIKQLFRKPYI